MKKKSYQNVFLLLVLICSILTSCTEVPSNKLPLTTNSDEAREAFNLGREHYYLNDLELATKELKRAVQLDENFAMAYLFLDLAYPSSAEVDMYRNKYAELSGQVSEGEALLLKAFQLNREGKGDLARDKIEALFEMYPKDPELPFLIGWAFYWNEDEKYIELMNKSIGIDPNYPHVYLGLGLKYANLKNWNEAEMAYEKYAELLPGEAMPVVILARLFREQGDMDKAIDMYEKALTIDPGHLFAIPGIGNCHLFRGECEEGREYFNKWFEIGNIYAEKSGALFSIATSYLYEDNIDLAAQGFDNYLAFAEENNESVDLIWGNAYKGYILLMNDRIEEGASYYRKGIELMSSLDLDDTRRADLLRNSHFWEAYASAAEGNFEKAWDEYDQFKELQEKRSTVAGSTTIHGIYGWIKQKEGKYDEAIESYKKADDSPFYWIKIAESYEGIGDNEKAKEYYQRISEQYLNTIHVALCRNKALRKLKEL